MCAVQPQGITLWGTERGMPHSLIFFFNKARFHTAYIYPTVYICFENKMICCTCTAHAFVRCACQHIKCVAHRHGYKQSMGQCNTFASCQYLSSLPQNFYNLLKVRLCITSTARSLGLVHEQLSPACWRQCCWHRPSSYFHGTDEVNQLINLISLFCKTTNIDFHDLDVVNSRACKQKRKLKFFTLYRCPFNGSRA